MRGIITFLSIFLSTNLCLAQECASFSIDSVEYTKQLKDVFFSPSGRRGIAIGTFSHNLLFKKDSVYWEVVTNNFGVYADANMISGLFVNEHLAVAVDVEGYIHSILDRGDDVSWGRDKYDGNKPLYDIDFYEDSLGIAVGLEGSVLSAIDFNGENFGTIPAFTTHDLYAVDIVNDSTIYIAGNNSAFKSTDFGESWNEITPETGIKYIDIQFFDYLNGIVIGEGGYIFVTDNGGEQWTEVSQSSYYGHLRKLAIYNDSIVYACGAMHVLVSYNKGYNWYKLPGLNELGRTYESIGLKDSQTAYLVENSGKITKYQIGNNLPPSEITLSDTAFYETGLDSLWVADIGVIDTEGNYESTDVRYGSGFFVENHSLKNQYGFSYFSEDFLNIYKITLAAIDSCGFEFEKDYNIRVLPYGPTDISLSNTDVREEQPIGIFIGKFTTNAHVQSSYTYELVSGSNDADNGSFFVSNDSLFTKEIFHVGTFNSREIRIRTVDDRSNSFEKSFFLTIVDETISSTPNISENKTIIFPNPVTSFIYLEGEHYKNYEIIDLSGTIKMNGRIEFNSLNVASLQTGVYILKLTDLENHVAKILFTKK